MISRLSDSIIYFYCLKCVFMASYFVDGFDCYVLNCVLETWSKLSLLWQKSGFMERFLGWVSTFQLDCKERFHRYYVSRDFYDGDIKPNPINFYSATCQYPDVSLDGAPSRSSDFTIGV